MDRLLTVAGVIAAVLIVVVSLMAVLLVSFASLREESARSLSGVAPNLAARVARRLLGFRGDFRSLPPSTATQARRSGGEVRFAYARRTLPDSSQQQAGRQPQPRTVRLDYRQPAGV